MPDYKSLYFKLFRAQSKIVEIIEEVHQQTEEIIMASDEPIDIQQFLKEKQDE